MKKEIKILLIAVVFLTIGIFIAEQFEEEVEERPEYCPIREERPNKIQQAYEEGKLTERQRDILLVREEFRGINRATGIQIEILNERGFDVTDEEMRELRILTTELQIAGFRY